MFSRIQPHHNNTLIYSLTCELLDNVGIWNVTNFYCIQHCTSTGTSSIRFVLILHLIWLIMIFIHCTDKYNIMHKQCKRFHISVGVLADPLGQYNLPPSKQQQHTACILYLHPMIAVYNLYKQLVIIDLI